MSEAAAVKEFKAGLTLLANGYASKAMAQFGRALELDPKNPFYMSYRGLALAAAEQKWDEAEELCYTAVRMRRTQPELYLNLAEVYRLANRKADAVEALSLGLQLTKRDPRLRQALRRLGVRRPPVLSFLDRQNFLNRELGRLRYRLLKTMGREV
jgi:Flp pilus assembly protein TadD